MASKTMRVLNIVSGVLLILIGIYCLCNQDIAAATAGLMVGIFMLAFGHYRDRCVCRNEQAADWLRLAIAGRCADSNFVTVPAVQ